MFKRRREIMDVIRITIIFAYIISLFSLYLQLFIPDEITTLEDIIKQG